MSNYNNSAAVSCLVLSNPSQPVQSKFNNNMRQSVHIQIGQEQIQIWENCPSMIASWKQGQTQYVQKSSKGMWFAVESYNEANAHVPQVAASVAPPDYGRQEQKQKWENSLSAAHVPNVAPQAHTVSASEYEAQNREIAMYTKRLAQVYRNCFETVQVALQDKGMSVELEKDIATSLFIQTTRKFNL